MKVMWCWRCKKKVPMLEEDEWEEVKPLYLEAIKNVKRVREETGASLEGEIVRRQYRPMLRAYERITGVQETDPSVVRHHRASLYGPPCENCGKPLRTPEAKLCSACGWRLPHDKERSGKSG